MVTRTIKGLLGELKVDGLIEIEKIPDNLTLLKVYVNCFAWYNEKYIYFRNKGDNARFYKIKNNVELYFNLKELI